MDVIEAIKWRRSVRHFAPRKIERDTIRQILEAGRLAPSSSNQQAWHFIVIDDEKIIRVIPDQVPAGTGDIISFAREAALIVVGCYARNITHRIAQLFGHENSLIDIAIAMTQMTLAATGLGVGTCWIGWFSEKRLKKLLRITDQYRIACMLALGYPAEKSTAEGIGGIKPRPRKVLKEIVSYNRFGVGLKE